MWVRTVADAKAEEHPSRPLLRCQDLYSSRMLRDDGLALDGQVAAECDVIGGECLPPQDEVHEGAGCAGENSQAEGLQNLRVGGSVGKSRSSVSRTCVGASRRGVRRRGYWDEVGKRREVLHGVGG